MAFWHGLDVEMGEELELGVPPLEIQLDNMGWWLQWAPEPELAQEGTYLLPLGTELLKVEDGAEQAQGDGATAKDDTVTE